MDKYSRLLLHFSTVTGSINEQEPYPNFVKELSVLEAPSSELCRIIKEDLPTILPAVLILSVHDDVSVRRAVSKTFDTFCAVLKTHPSVKNESWWKHMEDKLIAQLYSSKLVKMVEQNSEPWSNNWVFVINLIVVNSEHVHGVAINSLLKVVEAAFKMSKKNDQIMEKAYFCWNQLIDIFSVHPRVSVSQKLVELFVRPLSTTHLSLKCPELKMETWNNLMRKIAFSCGNKCKFIVEPFIDYMFMKGEDSLSTNFPKDSLMAFFEIVQQKKLYKHFAPKLLPAFPKCYERANDEELENIVTKIWTCLLENISDVNKDFRNNYILDIFVKFSQVSQMNKPELNKKLNEVFVEKNVFNIDNLRTCMVSETSFVPLFSVFFMYEDFREKSFSSVVKSLLDGFSETNNKQQNNIDLEIWDLLCDSYASWTKSADNSLKLSSADNESLSSLLMVPFVFRQWSVGAVQKTWYSLVDVVLSTVSTVTFLSCLFDKITAAIKTSQIPVGTCIEICTHVTDKDKLAFKLIMPTLHVTSHHVSPKEPKPLMDLMVLLENAVGHVPKNELTKFVNELMTDVNKYEHPWGIRIKTKCSKVQRKLLMVKESNEDTEEKASPGSQESDQPGATKTRSPVMAQSNFLHRLAKAEEKRKKKVPTHASVFGEPSLTGKTSPSTKSVKSEPSGQLSPVPNSTVTPVKNKDNGSRAEGEASGLLTPSIPTAVTIITPTRAKRAASKSPDPNHAKTKRQTLPKLAAPPPKYFDESAQEEFIVVPPKERTTPLTEHQKEILSKRRSDIPALYQDLSQDTQSMSQSIKEISFLKLVNSSEKQDELSTAKSDDTVTVNDENSGKSSNEISEPSSNEISSNIVALKSGIPQTETDGKKTPESSSDDSKIYSVDMFAQVVDSGTDNESKAYQDGLKSPNGGSEKTSTSLGRPEESNDIVEDSQPAEPIVSFNITPTKQPGPPTPRNLVSKLNLIEELEEEEELEKENKIINAKLNGDRDSITPIKRRSTRKSAGKLSSKSVEEGRETKGKQKKEPIEIPKIIVDSPDSLSKKLSTETDTHDGSVTNSVKVNGTPNKSLPESGSVLPPSSLTEKNSDEQVLNETIDLPASENTERPSKDLVTDKNNSQDFQSPDNNVVTDPEKDDQQLSRDTNLTSYDTIEDETKKLDETFTITDMEENQNVKLLNSEENEKSAEGSILSEENSESPGVGSWAMTASIPSKAKSKKKKSAEDVSQFSPKQLRSKRLSLTKNSDGAESAKKKQKETLPSKSITPKTKKSENDGNVPESETKEAESSLVHNRDKVPERKKNVSASLKIELTPNRKRRLVNGGNDEITEKKKKTDEDVSQDSILVVKNNLTGKPRKKKVIKSNVKISPNNLEQWLIKSGKTVVKTSLISQENGHSDAETSKMIEDSPDIHINVCESKNIVVEKVDLSTPPNEMCSPQKDSEASPLNNIDGSMFMDVDGSPLKGDEEKEQMDCSTSEENLAEENEDVEDIHNCTLVSDGESIALQLSTSSEDEVVLDAVKCEETEVPGTPETDAREMYLKRRRQLKREGTPVRELLPDSDEKLTPTRSQRPSRSAKMVRMATAEEEPQFHTPMRKRASIPMFNRTENWPEGRMEPWVPFLPTPPGISPSLGILKKKTAILSPTNSPSSSPQVRRKRVSFLDPVVYSGLMYAKGCSEAKGEVQYANIPPGEKPLWVSDEEEDEKTETSEETGEPSTSSDVSVEPTESVDELTAIQEFLKSTPDTPWSSSVPPELDITSIPGLESCLAPVDELLMKICCDDETFEKASQKLEEMNIKTVADLKSLKLAELSIFCKECLGAKPIAATVEMETLGKSRGKRVNKKEVISFGNETEQPIQSPLAELQNILPKEKRRRESRLKTPLPLNSPSEIDLKVSSDSKKLTRKKTNFKKSDILTEIIPKISKGKKEKNEQKEFVQEKKTRSKNADQTVAENEKILAEDTKASEFKVESINAKETRSPEKSPQTKQKRSASRASKPTVEVYEEKIEFIEEQIITVNVCKKGTQTLLQVDPQQDWPNQGRPSTSQNINEGISNEELSAKISASLPQLLTDSEFCITLASQIKKLPEKKFDNFIKMLFSGIAEKRGLGCISLAVNLLQNIQKELDYNTH